MDFTIRQVPLDASPTQQWHTEPPKEEGVYIAYTDLGVS